MSESNFKKTLYEYTAEFDSDNLDRIFIKVNGEPRLVNHRIIVFHSQEKLTYEEVIDKFRGSDSELLGISGEFKI